jgi:DNA-binding winged helix-turn-helix (wHTH) protein
MLRRGEDVIEFRRNRKELLLVVAERENRIVWKEQITKGDIISAAATCKLYDKCALMSVRT